MNLGDWGEGGTQRDRSKGRVLCEDGQPRRRIVVSDRAPQPQGERKNERKKGKSGVNVLYRVGHNSKSDREHFCKSSFPNR